MSDRVPTLQELRDQILIEMADVGNMRNLYGDTLAYRKGIYVGYVKVLDMLGYNKITLSVKADREEVKQEK